MNNQPSSPDLPPLDAWEALWAPYDEATYAAVLAEISTADVVLEIGAGDLRLARRLAERAQQVIAWEIQADLLLRALTLAPLPPNLTALVADARIEPTPPGITTAVLIMRHCTHYALYVAKLRAAGCRRLITNARWRTGVESIDLAPGVAFETAGAGWYTCRRCGAVGFMGDDPALVDEAVAERVTDVEGCPACRSHDRGTVSRGAFFDHELWPSAQDAPAPSI